MFLWKSRWVIGRAVSRPVIFDGPYCWAHTRLLSSAGPGAGRRRLVPGSGLAWWSSPHARGRRREVAHGCGGRDYGIGKAFTKKEAARPYPPRRVGEKEQGEERATGPPELYENPWTIPNLLCMARIGLSPYLGYLIVEQEFNLALGLFTLAGITDLLDGYIARNWANQKSALGSALDPLADKILISVLYVSLTCAELIPAPLTATVLLRDVTLIAAGFYIRYRTVPPPRTLSKYFNPCYATAQLKPTFISKVNTAVQLVLVAASLAAPVFQYVDSVFLHALWYATALTTTASAYSYYIHGKNTVQVLNRMK
ncbi:cardiolipin synthase (CMP-forming) isoform X1 [Scyliorhinus canicula]|uniref:cardiolipin synthase (CMP-forming) isoform X1 n=1 Tax=Scyliorhinus canicula TaxID=7830 RepID=UPI0018F76BC8|nr:cardiolipin synthase (CMP-forming) isoform X1 [Scyliorhinus canicula]